MAVSKDLSTTAIHTNKMKSNSQPDSLQGKSLSSLQKLTIAALALPGLLANGLCLAEDDAGLQYSHYEETKRNLYGSVFNNKPISVDSLHGGGQLALTEKLNFAFNFNQDTWGGATPISTAPLALGLNENIYKNGQVTGASPIINRNGGIYIDRQTNHLLKYLNTDNNTGVENFGLASNQLVHTMAVASPETRKQGDIKLGYVKDETAVDFGGGLSIERDYASYFANLGGRQDFNHKLTTLSGGVSFTSSRTNALMDHDVVPYLNNNYYLSTGQLKVINTDYGTIQRLQSDRQDWTANLGLTQVLNKSALFDFGLTFSQATGYLANPYKAVEAIFVDPNQIPDCGAYFCDGRTANVLVANAKAFLEKRPSLHNQFSLSSRYVQYINPFDAALHFDYQFAADDWGILAHTFNADWEQPITSGWSITPHIRYYSQDKANFYHPFLIINKASIGKTDYINLPANYSSDQRLSGYGALSGGVTLGKQFTKGVKLEASIDYYNHDGALKLGGGGEADYANFKYYMASASIKVDLTAIDNAIKAANKLQNYSAADEPQDHSKHAQHKAKHKHGTEIPSGVMFAHMLDNPGDYMVGYRYMNNSQSGNILHGTNPVSDQTIVSHGCVSQTSSGCYIRPSYMAMNMHMLEFMYAPTDWLNFMLMPQFMDMNMHLQTLAGAPALPNGSLLENHIQHHVSAGHSTGGIGDTGFYSMFKLYNAQDHQLNLTLGGTAPTGDVGIQLRRTHQEDGGFIHYGMQLGSGTWDFKPSLTYTGKLDDWSWGAQLAGTKRLQDRNTSGFSFGDEYQATAWGGYAIFDWLNTTVRSLYTNQGAVNHAFGGFIERLGPMDYPQNYGGRYWDIGLGLNATLTGGKFIGNKLAFEWLQPVSTDVNGYQLNRDGALSVTWGLMF